MRDREELEQRKAETSTIGHRPSLIAHLCWLTITVKFRLDFSPVRAQTDLVVGIRIRNGQFRSHNFHHEENSKILDSYLYVEITRGLVSMIFP